MSALKWILVVVSSLASLGVSAAGLVLASMFRSSGSDSDRVIGLVIGLVAVLWLGLPGGGAWLLLRTERSGWGIGLLVAGLVGSLALVGLIFGAIEAAARP
ncbi:MAG: hypothetical protein U0228_16075 [Myxococcaceae bacterium]